MHAHLLLCVLVVSLAPSCHGVLNWVYSGFFGLSSRLLCAGLTDDDSEIDKINAPASADKEIERIDAPASADGILNVVSAEPKKVISAKPIQFEAMPAPYAVNATQNTLSSTVTALPSSVFGPGNDNDQARYIRMLLVFLHWLLLVLFAVPRWQ